MDEAIAVARGERAPSRVWKVTKRADGGWARIQLDPIAIRARNRADYDKRQIVEARAALGLSQSKFAGLLGVSVDTLQNWEQGRRKPSGATCVLLRIAAKIPRSCLPPRSHAKFAPR